MAVAPKGTVMVTDDCWALLLPAPCSTTPGGCRLCLATPAEKNFDSISTQ